MQKVEELTQRRPQNVRKAIEDLVEISSAIGAMIVDWIANETSNR